MTEAEVRGLCLKSREIFLQQSILLELEAPLKICGKNMLLKNMRALNTKKYVNPFKYRTRKSVP